MELFEALRQNIDLYQLDFDQGPVIFKLLPYDSYLGFKRIIINHPRLLATVEEEIWQECILVNPFKVSDDNSIEYLNDLAAGIVSTVAQVVLFLSEPKTFGSLMEQFDLARAQVANIFHLEAQAFIASAFPGMNPKELLHLTIPELFIYLAQAEIILNKTFDLQPPDKQKKKQEGIDVAAENREFLEQYGRDPFRGF